MEDKKYIKISLGTLICIFIIFILIFIILGMWYYYNNIDTNNNTLNNNISNNNMINNESNENTETIINNIGNITDTENTTIYPIQIGTFFIFDVPPTLTEEFGHYYDDTGIILYENNTFKISIEEGSSITGKYNINGNILTCIATNLQDNNDNLQKINAEFTFKAIHNSGIQLSNITGNIGTESHALEIGNKYILP